jgi:hypothetical protein
MKTDNGAVKQAAVIIGLLGKASDSPEVDTWLKQAGATPPKLKKGDFDAHVVLADDGLELTFTDEAKFNMRNDLAIGEGALLLTAVRFTSASVPDFKPYPGALPYGLAFTNSQSEVHGVIGKAEMSNPRLRIDRWTRDEHWVFAKYNQGLGGLQDLTVQLPPKAK